MPDNIKDFIIFCTNTNEESVKLHIKNMPDSDERENIAFLKKKTKYILNIFYVLLIACWCSMIACCVWTWKHADDGFVYVLWIGLLLFFVGSCAFKSFFEEIFRKHLIRKNGCEFMQQYLKDYSVQEWRRLQYMVERAYSILSLLDARTPEGTLMYANLQNQAAVVSIVFRVSYFKLEWTSYAKNGDQIQKEDLFNTGHVIKNCKLEKDTVEYDFLKNEFRVPLNFIYDF